MRGSAGGIYSTYCDFAVGGGGWTLVASVHEDNIKAKCNTKDLWTNTNGNGGDVIHAPHGVLYTRGTRSIHLHLTHVVGTT